MCELLTNPNDADAGLYAVEFGETREFALHVQATIDIRMARLWDLAIKSDILDVTRLLSGEHYETLMSERYNLWNYSPSRSGQQQFLILDNILPSSACAEMDRLVSNNWQPIEPRYRAADVYVLSAIRFSRTLEIRLAPYIPKTITDEYDQVWDLVGANNGFFRLIRYVTHHDNYPLHYDLMGNRLDNGCLPGCQDDESKGRRSEVAKTMLTFNMYLNGSESFDGGEFTLYNTPSNPMFTIEPKAGRGFVMRQGQTKGYLHSAGAVDLRNHPGSAKSLIRADYVYKQRSQDTTMPMSQCRYCPERFADKPALILHEDIHANPTSDAYMRWHQKLETQLC
jgi:hypothetical protein